MKIEMAESLVASWLSHVIKCQVVQTNWKIDPSLFNKEASFINKLYEIENVRDYLGDGKIETIVRQGECDVLGIKFGDDGYISEIHAVDVAFHTNGLGYGGKKENIKRIVKKCLRTAICIYGGLHINNIIPVHVYFATPLITDDEFETTNKQLAKIKGPLQESFNKKLNSEGINFHILANEAFYCEIVNKLTDLCNTIHDTNELFLRSYQLLRMGENFRSNINTKKKSRGGKSVKKSPEATTTYLANVVLRNLLTLITLKPKELDELTKFKILYDEVYINENSTKKSTWYVKPIKQNDTNYWIHNDCRNQIETLQNIIKAIWENHKAELQLHDEEELYLI